MTEISEHCQNELKFYIEATARGLLRVFRLGRLIDLTSKKCNTVKIPTASLSQVMDIGATFAFMANFDTDELSQKIVIFFDDEFAEIARVII